MIFRYVVFTKGTNDCYIQEYKYQPTITLTLRRIYEEKWLFWDSLTYQLLLF